MKKEELLQPEIFCPVRQTIKMLGKRWTMLIIKEIYYSKTKKLSFMELKRRLVNVSTKVLSERLKDMIEDELLERKEQKDLKPARVYYSLTSKGEDVCQIVNDFKEYGLKWGGNKTFDCKDMDCELCFEMRDEKKHPGRNPPSH